MAQKPETKFRNGTVIPFLKSLPHCDITSVQQLARSGDPDLYICLAGVFVALELKASATSKLRPLQEWKLAKIKAAGGIALVAYPENWQDVKQTLLTILNKQSA